MREGDALGGLRELDHLEVELVAHLRGRTVLLDQLAGRAEALDVLAQSDNGALVGHLGNRTLVDALNRELSLEAVPGVLLQLLVAQREATVLLVDLEYDHVDVGTDLRELTRVLHLLGPAQIRDVDQAVDALLDLDEYAEVREVAHLGRALRADGVLGLDVLPRIGRQLLDAERHLALLTVEGQDNGLHLVADLHELLGRTQVLAPRHFGYVDQPLHTRSDLDECAVVSHDNDTALDLVADLEVGIESLPRMRGELLQTQGDTLLLVVEVEDHDVDLLIERNDLLGVVHAAPREVGDVNQTVHTAQIDEYAVGGDVLDGTLEDLTLLELRHDDLLLGLELGLDKGLVRNDHVAELLVDLHHLELHGLVYIDVVVADGLHVDLRTGEEGLDAEDIDDHAALGAALDVTLDDLVLLQGLIDTIPALELTGLLVRESQLAVLVLGRLDVDLDLVTDLQIGIVAELRYGDHALALVADVHQHLALGDGRYGTLDHFADSDVRKRLVISLGDLLLGLIVHAQIVLEGVPVEILVCDHVLYFFHCGN